MAKIKIPLELYRLYSVLGWKMSFYARWRWRLCVFETIEHFITKSARVVDIGCGYGLLANYISSKSEERQVLGLDGSKRRIEMAKGAGQDIKNVTFAVKDISNIELDNFDVAIMSDFLHHLSFDCQKRLLDKIASNLKSGSRLIILEVDRKPWWKYLVNLFVDHILNVGKRICYRTKVEWIKILQELGFTVESFPADKNLPLADVLFICNKK